MPLMPVSLDDLTLRLKVSVAEVLQVHGNGITMVTLQSIDLDSNPTTTI